MGSKQFKKELANLRTEITINPEWKEAQRSILVSKIKSQHDYSQTSMFSYWVSQKAVHVFRPMATFAVFCVFIFGGVAVTFASNSAVQGDILYSVKMTTERLQITFVKDENKKADLKLKNAIKRTDEIRVLASREVNPTTKAALDSTFKEYSKVIAEVQATVSKGGENDKVKTVDLAKNLKQTTSAAKVTLAAITVDQESQVALDDAKSNTDKAELSAVLTIAKQSSDKVEAKETLQDYLKGIGGDVDAISEEVSVDPINDTVESVVTEEVPALTEKVEEVPLKVDPIPSTSVFTIQPLIKKTVVDEVQALLDANDIDGALEAIESGTAKDNEVIQEEAPTEEVTDPVVEPVVN